MSNFKPLSLLPQRFPWVTSDGNITDLARRWLNDLRDGLNLSFIVTADWTPASVAANTTAEQTVTVAGTVVGDHVSVTPPGNTAGVSLTAARVSAANTVAVTFVNPTAGAVTPLTGDHVFKVTRP